MPSGTPVNIPSIIWDGAQLFSGSKNVAVALLKATEAASAPFSDTPVTIAPIVKYASTETIFIASPSGKKWCHKIIVALSDRTHKVLRSAIHPKADSCSATRHVRYGP